jgi:hypothetical protein
MDDAARVRLLSAAVLFALVVAPIGFAAAADDADDPTASASSSVKKKVKKLTKRVTALEAQLADVKGTPGPAGPRGPQGPEGPSTGPAGGDLMGTYPDPLIAGNAVGPDEVQNPIRSVNLPIGSFHNLTDSALIDFTVSDGTAPDFGTSGNGINIIWDNNAVPPADTDFVTSSLVVPPDYASGGSVALRVNKTGHGGVAERLTCSTTVNSTTGSTASVTTTTASDTLYVVTPGGTYAPGDDVRVNCAVDDGTPLGSTADHVVFLHGLEWRYTATQ